VQRLKFLDGLRGWGAVFVLLYHVFCDALPMDVSLGEYLQHLIPFNGAVAVYVFFLVSGFSLSVRYLSDGELRSWLDIVAGRYLRLAIPIFAACLLVHLGMVSGLVDAPGDRLPKLSSILNFQPTIGHLLKFSLFDVFFHYDPLETYLGPLWTMWIELSGSFIILLAILAVRSLRWRLLALLGLACFILALAPTSNSAALALFPIGGALAECFNRGWIAALPKRVAFLLLAVGCSVPILLPVGVMAWGVIGSSTLIVGCIAIPKIRDWLGGTVSTHLGKISFPLYLVHAAVIVFVGEPLMRRFGQGLPLRFLIDMAVVGLSFAAAYAFLPVNQFAIIASHRFARLVTGFFLVSPATARR
jgi:peptidoglycan/LPS O-acetylase OafA/YrhL